MSVVRPGTLVDISVAGWCRFANQAIHGEVARRMAAAGHGAIRQHHFPVFRILYNCPEGLRSTSIAEQVKLSKPTVKELLDYLENEGYVERIPEPLDRRAHPVRLTDRGWDACKICWPIVADVELELASIVGTEQLLVVREALQKLTEAFEPNRLS